MRQRGVTERGKKLLAQRMGKSQRTAWREAWSDHVEPHHVWSLFYTDEMLEILVRETNAYAAYKRARPRPPNLDERRPWPPSFLNQWYDVTLKEMRIYIGITYAYGMSKCPGLNNFYRIKPSATYRRPPVCDMMSRDRYRHIKSCLHVRNELTPLAEGEMKKIGDYLKMFNGQCLTVYAPGEFLSLDEMMIRFEGNFHMVHRKQHKPTSEGMKMYAICDGVSGYTVTFELDQRKSELQISDFISTLCTQIQGEWQQPLRTTQQPLRNNGWKDV